MPISPFESQITFSGATAASVYILSFREEHDFEFFQRMEFSNKLRQDVVNADGSTPQWQTSITGHRYFRDINCGDPVDPRSELPDDDLLDDIYQRFDIERFDIGGATSNPAAVNALNALFLDHRIRRARFENHIQTASRFVSIDVLDELKLESFSYLTVTNLSMTGPALEGVTKTQLLIRRFNPDVDFEYDDGSGTSVVYKTFTMLAEKLTIKPASAVYPYV